MRALLIDPEKRTITETDFEGRKFRGFEVSEGRGRIGDHLVETVRVDLKAPIIDGADKS